MSGGRSGAGPAQRGAEERSAGKAAGGGGDTRAREATRVLEAVGAREATAARAGASAYDALRALILRGGVAPGTRLTENEVAARLEVSRTPAREALRRLEAEGLLTAVGQGARVELAVAPLTRADLEEVYLLMGALEGAAALRVAELTPAERRRLHAHMTEAERAFEAQARRDPRDLEQMFAKHNAVHAALVECCAGPRLQRLLDGVRPLSDRYEWLYAPLVGPDYGATFREHRAMIAAVRKGDADAAARAVRANWSNGAARLLEAFDRWGGRGEWGLAERGGELRR